jgi:hypothetical protein
MVRLKVIFYAKLFNKSSFQFQNGTIKSGASPKFRGNSPRKVSN